MAGSKITKMRGNNKKQVKEHKKEKGKKKGSGVSHERKKSSVITPVTKSKMSAKLTL